MKRLMSPELDRTRPVWRRVAAAIESRIAEGEYPVGARVPSVVELSAEFGIAASTAQKALTHLKTEGSVPKPARGRGRESDPKHLASCTRTGQLRASAPLQRVPCGTQHGGSS